MLLIYQILVFMKLSIEEKNNMEKYLFNLALIDTINFCKANNIDCSGSALWKVTRKPTYVLAKYDNGKFGKSLVSVTFHKNQVPSHIIYN